MKNKWVIIFGIIILIVIICIFVFKKDNIWDIMDWPWMVNEVSSYSVKISPRDSMPWEDIYAYDENNNLVLSLDDEDQPQYFYVLYGDYIVLDSGTSASSREILVYNIPSGKLTYKSNYYPWDKWLRLNWNEITFYKEINNSELSNYTLPNCENEYDNGYIENYGYTIWEEQANDLWDIQCAYFE